MGTLFTKFTPSKFPTKKKAEKVITYFDDVTANNIETVEILWQYYKRKAIQSALPPLYMPKGTVVINDDKHKTPEQVLKDINGLLGVIKAMKK